MSMHDNQTGNKSVTRNIDINQRDSALQQQNTHDHITNMSIISDVGQLPNVALNAADIERTRSNMKSEVNLDDVIKVQSDVHDSKMGKAMNSQTNIFNGGSQKLLEHNTTLDLMYSYDAPKVGYSEDTIKRMNLKIK